MRHLWSIVSIWRGQEHRRDPPHQREHVDVDRHDRLSLADVEKGGQHGNEKSLATGFVRCLGGPEEHVESKVGSRDEET
jgi:hypothetical protein